MDPEEHNRRTCLAKGVDGPQQPIRRPAVRVRLPAQLPAGFMRSLKRACQQVWCHGLLARPGESALWCMARVRRLHPFLGQACNIRGTVRLRFI